MSLSSRDSGPGFGTPPRGELLLILVKFLGMEQVPLSVLKKTRCAQGLCLLALTMPAVAFIWSCYPEQEKQPLGRLAHPTYGDVSQCPWWLPVVLVAGTGAD